jgi:hypothetical protein
MANFEDEEGRKFGFGTIHVDTNSFWIPRV